MMDFVFHGYMLAVCDDGNMLYSPVISPPADAAALCCPCAWLDAAVFSQWLISNVIPVILGEDARTGLMHWRILGSILPPTVKSALVIELEILYGRQICP